MFTIKVRTLSATIKIDTRGLEAEPWGTPHHTRTLLNIKYCCLYLITHESQMISKCDWIKDQCIDWCSRGAQLDLIYITTLRHVCMSCCQQVLILTRAINKLARKHHQRDTIIIYPFWPNYYLLYCLSTVKDITILLDYYYLSHFILEDPNKILGKFNRFYNKISSR